LPKAILALSQNQIWEHKNPVYNGITCFGEDLSSQTEIHQLELVIKAYNNTTDKSKFFNPFYKTSWNTQLQQQIETGVSESEDQKELGKGLDQFKENEDIDLLERHSKLFALPTSGNFFFISSTILKAAGQ
jgi:hypothetical protein